MKKLLIIFLLLIPCASWAASSRVLPSAYTEYTYDSAGGGEDYTALATWEADTDIDVRSTGQVLTCSSGIHADSVSLAGAITDADGFRVIRAASGARGTPTSGCRFENLAVTSNMFTLAVAAGGTETVYIYDIAVKATSTTTNIYAVAFYCATSKLTLVGCTAYDCVSSGTGGFGAGVYLGYFSGATSTIINCFFTGCTGTHAVSSGIYVNEGVAGTSSFLLYNNTITGCKTGLYASGTTTATITLTSKNNIFQDNTTNVYTNVRVTHNQTTNATSGCTFAADGYHLDSTDTGAIGNGTDLSSDGVFAFDDDIDGETRNDWDIGCDEYVVSGPAAAPAGSQIIWFY